MSVERHPGPATCAAFGVAGPVRDGRSETTNLPWLVDAHRLAAQLKLKSVGLINDLEANAYGLMELEPDDMVVLNEAEARMLAEEANLVQAARKILSWGPEGVVVKQGEYGAIYFADGHVFSAPAYPLEAVFDPTGAGDSFGSGCVAAFIKGKSIEEALLWGTVNSASVIGYAGAQKGLLREDQIGEWLERAKSCEVSVSEF